MSSDSYENFRTVLTMNLCQVLPADKITAALDAVDITMSDFEITKKSMAIIPADGIPDVVKYYIAAKAIANKSKGTMKQYRYKLINFFDTVRKSFADVTANDVRLYLHTYKAEHKVCDRYIDSIRTTLNGFFEWLVDNDYIQRNPCRKVEHIKYQVKRREAFTTFALEDLRWRCKTPREKALVDFLYSSGIRVSECADVLLSDIDWDNNTVHIRHGKGDEERTTFFNDEAKLSMQEYIKTRDDDTPALWVSMKKPHQQLTSHALEDIIRKIGKRTGVHAYPHKFRHTFATVGLRNGVPLDQLQLLMGHKSPKTTLIYAEHDLSQVSLEHRKAFN